MTEKPTLCPQTEKITYAAINALDIVCQTEADVAVLIEHIRSGCIDCRRTMRHVLSEGSTTFNRGRDTRLDCAMGMIKRDLPQPFSL